MIHSSSVSVGSSMIIAVNMVALVVIEMDSSFNKGVKRSNCAGVKLLDPSGPMPLCFNNKRSSSDDVMAQRYN